MKNKLFLLVVASIALTVNGFSQNARPRLKLISKESNLPVDVYRVVGLEDDGTYTTFDQIFSCISDSLEKMIISDKDILTFFRDNYEWFQHNGNWQVPHIFLGKDNGKYVAKRIYPYNNEYSMFSRAYEPLGGMQSIDIFCQPLVVVPHQKIK